MCYSLLLSGFIAFTTVNSFQSAHGQPFVRASDMTLEELIEHVKTFQESRHNIDCQFEIAVHFAEPFVEDQQGQWQLKLFEKRRIRFLGRYPQYRVEQQFLPAVGAQDEGKTGETRMVGVWDGAWWIEYGADQKEYTIYSSEQASIISNCRSLFLGWETPSFLGRFPLSDVLASAELLDYTRDQG